MPGTHKKTGSDQRRSRFPVFQNDPSAVSRYY
jgi:hypothetical protein